eukprot:scaffold366528_cov20-Prasinocladus_malaysianus.AAC.2
MKASNELQRGEGEMFKLENIDFGRRVAVEREMLGAEAVPHPNAVFDDTSNFILYPTLLGIKVRPFRFFSHADVSSCALLELTYRRPVAYR